MLIDKLAQFDIHPKSHAQNNLIEDFLNQINLITITDFHLPHSCCPMQVGLVADILTKPSAQVQPGLHICRHNGLIPPHSYHLSFSKQSNVYTAKKRPYQSDNSYRKIWICCKYIFF